MSDEHASRSAGFSALASALLCCLCAAGPALLIRLDIATAPSGGHLGDGLIHAAPFLLGEVMLFLAAPAFGLLTIVLAFSAMRRGSPGLARLSLLLVLGLLLYELQSLRRENAALPPPVDFGPRDPKCEAAALSGHPCLPPPGPPEKNAVPVLQPYSP